MAVEKRKQPRRHLIYYLKVVEPASEELIGHLVDISSIGLMMISKQPLEPGQIISLKLILPSVFEGPTHVDLVGKSVWCHKDVNPDYYAIGFQFLEPTPEIGFLVQDLVNSFGFQD